MTVMTGDARRALTRLLNAFENHFDIARDGDEADDAALEAAELALRDAFSPTTTFSLLSWVLSCLPFDILDDSDEDDDDFDDSDEDEEDGDEDDEDDDFIEVDD